LNSDYFGYHLLVYTCSTDGAVQLKGQIPLRYPGRRQVRSWSQIGSKLVTDRSEAGGRPAASWNLVYHLAR